MDEITVEILHEDRVQVAQTIGPFPERSDAEAWILDQFGEFPSDETRITEKPLPDDAIRP